VGEAAVLQGDVSVLEIVVQQRLGKILEQKEPASHISELEAKKDPRFQTEDGRLDKVKYREYLASLSQLVREADPEIDSTWIERKMARFITHRVEEAEIFFELHLLPGNVPWNRIAHWRIAIWQSYAHGKAKAMREKYR